MGKAAVWTVWMTWLVPVVVSQLPPAPKEGGREAAPAPRLVVVERRLDLGSVFEGDKVTVRWLLQNQGDADLVIDGTKAGCGCTVVKLGKEEMTVPPGKSLDLEAEFDSTRRRGKQTKKVTVYSNDPVEPTLKLEFTAQVEFLYETKPPGALNLRAIQRGRPSSATLEIIPGKGRHAVEILGIELPENVPLASQYEPFEARTGTGQRVRFTVSQFAGLGTLSARATIKLKVDGIERTRVVAVRGEVVGDLTFLPKVVDATRQKSRHGKRFAPVTIRSTNKAPFEILSASAGPLLDVTYEAKGNARSATQYEVHLAVRQDAPAGPFGATLEVRTTSLDQPLVRIPVFGRVAPVVEVDPPLVLLRADGTPTGTVRRLKVQTFPQDVLDIREITCENKAVVATVDREASLRYRHLRFLDVKLVGDLRPGTHETVLILTTSLAGAERLKIPVTVEVPE